MIGVEFDFHVAQVRNFAELALHGAEERVKVGLFNVPHVFEPVNLVSMVQDVAGNHTLRNL